MITTPRCDLVMNGLVARIGFLAEIKRITNVLVVFPNNGEKHVGSADKGRDGDR